MGALVVVEAAIQMGLVVPLRSHCHRRHRRHRPVVLVVAVLVVAVLVLAVVLVVVVAPGLPFADRHLRRRCSLPGLFAGLVS